MRLGTNTLMLSAITILASCAGQEPKPEASPAEAVRPAVADTESEAHRPVLPPKRRLKNGKPLELVKIMDGGICKNDYQGLKGEFLVYADAQDVERIKRQKGPAIFAEFEAKIQDLSTQALQQAAELTNLAEDPFALGPDQAQQNLLQQFNSQFSRQVDVSVKKFLQETSLNIDIVPFSPTLVFFQHGCAATEIETER